MSFKEFARKHTNRVMVDEAGLSVTPRRAQKDYGIEPQVIFIRHDGWKLGAPIEFADAAYATWQRQWTHFVLEDGQTLEISMWSSIRN